MMRKEHVPGFVEQRREVGARELVDREFAQATFPAGLHDDRAAGRARGAAGAGSGAGFAAGLAFVALEERLSAEHRLAHLGREHHRRLFRGLRIVFLEPRLCVGA